MSRSTQPPADERPQHMRNLDLANQVRFARAATKNELSRLAIGDARARLAELLECPPDHLARIPVDQLLKSCRGVGQRRSTKLLRDAAIAAHDKHVGRLTERQRSELARRLRREDEQLEMGLAS